MEQPAGAWSNIVALTVVDSTRGQVCRDSAGLIALYAGPRTVITHDGRHQWYVATVCDSCAPDAHGQYHVRFRGWASLFDEVRSAACFVNADRVTVVRRVTQGPTDGSRGRCCPPIRGSCVTAPSIVTAQHSKLTNAFTAPLTRHHVTYGVWKAHGVTNEILVSSLFFFPTLTTAWWGPWRQRERQIVIVHRSTRRCRQQTVTRPLLRRARCRMCSSPSSINTWLGQMRAWLSARAATCNQAGSGSRASPLLPATIPF